MNYHIRDYQRALELIMSSPLALCENDFDCLHSFHPADETRARDAVRQAQLALVPIEPKAVAPRSTAPPVSRDVLKAVLADVGDTIRKIIVLRDAKIADLTARLAELEARAADETASVAELRKALLDMKATVFALELVAEHPHTPDLPRERRPDPRH